MTVLRVCSLQAAGPRGAGGPALGLAVGFAQEQMTLKLLFSPPACVRGAGLPSCMVLSMEGAGGTAEGGSAAPGSARPAPPWSCPAGDSPISSISSREPARCPAARRGLLLSASFRASDSVLLLVVLTCVCPQPQPPFWCASLPFHSEGPGSSQDFRAGLSTDRRPFPGSRPRCGPARRQRCGWSSPCHLCAAGCPHRGRHL